MRVSDFDRYLLGMRQDGDSLDLIAEVMETTVRRCRDRLRTLEARAGTSDPFEMQRVLKIRAHRSLGPDDPIFHQAPLFLVGNR